MVLVDSHGVHREMADVLNLLDLVIFYLLVYYLASEDLVDSLVLGKTVADKAFVIRARCVETSPVVVLTGSVGHHVVVLGRPRDVFCLDCGDVLRNGGVLNVDIVATVEINLVPVVHQRITIRKVQVSISVGEIFAPWNE